QQAAGYQTHTGMNNEISEAQSWVQLPATEKEGYLQFHRKAFEEDMKHAEKNAIEFPRWSIISGYYCMHDITKLFLAEKFGIKITSPTIHIKAIEALEQFIKDEGLKRKIIELLKEAKDIYFSAERLKEKTLPALLKKGRQERGTAQYYSEDYTKQPETNPKKALYFLDTIVKPYTSIIKGLME
ncbi:MAG: hypothetical protein QME12_09405, partial [Nanoarchaeota archaeon]|nr:hypothetical protein [Nanoarchaeota archaeon]